MSYGRPFSTLLPCPVFGEYFSVHLLTGSVYLLFWVHSTVLYIAPLPGIPHQEFCFSSLNGKYQDRLDKT